MLMASKVFNVLMTVEMDDPWERDGEAAGDGVVGKVLDKGIGDDLGGGQSGSGSGVESKRG
jgi:hypothetical protein